MISFKKLVPCLLVLIAILFTAVPAVFAQQQPHPAASAASPKQGAQQPAAANPKPADDATPDLEDAMPINAEKIDEAGKVLGKKIDAVTASASVRFGRWINTKAFGDISWLKLMVCAGLVLFVFAAERALRRAISLNISRADQKAEPRWVDMIIKALAGPLTVFVRVYGVYWALSPIWLYLDSTGAGGSFVHKAASRAADLGGTVALFWFIYRFIFSIDFKIKKWVGATENGIHDMLVPLVSKTVRVIVLVVGGMLVLQNMTGIELGPLVASLGIGGLAFALAGKDSISNFLGSLTILLDKPFSIGERIVIDKHDGFVEDVGFRSTRIRTLAGNLVSIPNEKIINSTLENVARREYLRWDTELGLTCDTPPDKVERAVRILEEILKNHEGMNDNYPPRVHFNGFKDWSLNVSIFAWYFPPDFWKFQSWVQKMCLEIMRRFREEGIEMAYPTQAVYQMGTENQQPAPAAPSGKP